MPRALQLLLLLALAGAAGCREQSNAPAKEEMRRPSIGPELAPSRPNPDDELRRSCESKMRQVLAAPAVPGVPALDSSRPLFFARVKAEPTLFVRAPVYSSEDATLTVRGYRQMLLSGKNPFGVVTRILAESEGFPKQARGALLREGYLYADDPKLARWLVALVQPHQLFGHERIWIERGEELLHARRGEDGRYYYEDGLLEGQRARFILFDRAGAGDGPGPALHRDLRALRYRLSFDRMRIRHVTEDHIVANLLYGRWWVPSLLRTSGPHVELVCDIADSGLRAEVDAFRQETARRQELVQALRRAMLEAVADGLPFDEPRHEYGSQLDGTLRGKWLEAYARGRNYYDFNGDEYAVFGPSGHPLVPEVCADFLTDTLERASGTWWRPRGEPRERTVGKLDFGSLKGEALLDLRRATGFIAYAMNHRDAFDVWEPTERIELGDEEAFYSFLQDHVSDFALGDAILIKGKTPWDPLEVHFHSFFVYESDPITGMPIVILGNAGVPRLRVWDTEVRRTPKRAVVARVRFKTSWLERVVTVEPLESVAPLAAGTE